MIAPEGYPHKRALEVAAGLAGGCGRELLAGAFTFLE
jgi:hypothetical protein